MGVATKLRHSRFNGRRVRNILKTGKRFGILPWEENGVHEHGEPKSPRKYEDVVDYFHNYQHSPEGLTHCTGSEANPYKIVHVLFGGRVEHKISLSYARGHGEGNKEQWFRFRDYLEDGYHLETGEPIPEPPRDKWNVRESRYLSTRRARHVQGSVVREMARRPKAGQKQRIGSGDWETGTNRQQRKLVRVYDEWAAGVKRELARQAKNGATIPELQSYIDQQIPKLEERLVEIQTKGIQSAVKSAAGSRAELPAVLGMTDQQIRENVTLIRNNLVPKIHEKLTLALATAVPAIGIGITGLAVDQQRAVALAVKNATVAGRSMPAQYAGGYWVAIFETEKTLGGVREDERAAEGLPPEPVRWDLDPRAVHCKPSPGFYGCAELAGEYPGGWRTLPTVPAGQVTCRGNCRCRISVFRNGEWRRGVYDD